MNAADLVRDLERQGCADEVPKIRKRLADGETCFGVRMGTLFALAKGYAGLGLDEVETLLDHPAYEPRMAAFCILDFQARRRLPDTVRAALCELYLRRHDAITTWDMVDRSAPRVVGGHLAGGPATELDDLVVAGEPLRRRTAVTAPLFFVHAGADADVERGLAIARRVVTDPEPVVHNAVGILLKHTGARDVSLLRAFLDQYAAVMPRPALRLATEKLPEDLRLAYRAARP